MPETLTPQQALAAQKALRDELNLPEEHFPKEAFIGMVSDEIEQARDAGRDDEAIATLLSDASGMAVSADDIAEHYAPPERRAHP